MIAEILLAAREYLSDTDCDEMLQISNTYVIALLTTGITLNMLKETTEESELGLAIRALVLIVLVPSIDVVFALIAFVGKVINLAAIDSAGARSRLEMDQHG